MRIVVFSVGVRGLFVANDELLLACTRIRPAGHMLLVAQTIKKVAVMRGYSSSKQRSTLGLA